MCTSNVFVSSTIFFIAFCQNLSRVLGTSSSTAAPTSSTATTTSTPSQTNIQESLLIVIIVVAIILGIVICLFIYVAYLKIRTPSDDTLAMAGSPADLEADTRPGGRRNKSPRGRREQIGFRPKETEGPLSAIDVSPLQNQQSISDRSGTRTPSQQYVLSVTTPGGTHHDNVMQQDGSWHPPSYEETIAEGDEDQIDRI